LLSHFQAELSLLSAGQAETMAAIRRAENAIWHRGVPNSISNARIASYQAARALDPDFTALIADWTQLADHYRQKRDVELQVMRLYRQAQPIVRRLRKLEDEYERVREGEAL